jgi:hypothetical protein
MKVCVLAHDRGGAVGVAGRDADAHGERRDRLLHREDVAHHRRTLLRDVLDLLGTVNEVPRGVGWGAGEEEGGDRAGGARRQACGDVSVLRLSLPLAMAAAGAHASCRRGRGGSCGAVRCSEVRCGALGRPTVVASRNAAPSLPSSLAPLPVPGTYGSRRRAGAAAHSFRRCPGACAPRSAAAAGQSALRHGGAVAQQLALQHRARAPGSAWCPCSTPGRVQHTSRISTTFLVSNSVSALRCAWLTGFGPPSRGPVGAPSISAKKIILRH